MASNANLMHVGFCGHRQNTIANFLLLSEARQLVPKIIKMTEIIEILSLKLKGMDTELCHISSRFHYLSDSIVKLAMVSAL